MRMNLKNWKWASVSILAGVIFVALVVLCFTETEAVKRTWGGTRICSGAGRRRIRPDGSGGHRGHPGRRRTRPWRGKAPGGPLVGLVAVVAVGYGVDGWRARVYLRQFSAAPTRHLAAPPPQTCRMVL